MGLALFEIFNEVEDRFCITIECDEVEKNPLQTVGQLYLLVLEKVDLDKWIKEDPIQTKDLRVLQSEDIDNFKKIAVERLRDSLSDLFYHPRSSLILSAHMENLIPLQNRRENWKKLQENLGCKLLKLSFSDELDKFLIGFGFWATLCSIITEFTKVDPEFFKMDMSFRDDLGIN